MPSKREAWALCSGRSTNFKARLEQNGRLSRQLTSLPAPRSCYTLSRKTSVASSHLFPAVAVKTPLLSFLKRSESPSLPFPIQDALSTGECSSYVQNTRLQHLCKHGSLQDACLFFSEMNKDSFSWNMMMSEYVQLGCNTEALHLFDQMQNEGIIPNKFIVATVLSACAVHGQIEAGKQMHARIEISEEGFCADSVVQTALVNLYGRFGELEIARRIFESGPSQNIGLWNAILTVFAQHGQGQISWPLFSRMQLLGILLNKVTCIILLSVCANEANLKRGKELHSWVMNMGLEDNIVVGTALINMYGRCRCMEMTDHIFDRLLYHDLILWNTMISGQSLNEMQEKVFQSFDQMQQEGVMPNIITFISTLDACRSPSALEKGKLVHACILGIDFETETMAGAALVNMYGKCGSLDAALEMFDKMGGHKDTILWNTMISIYVKHGVYWKAMQLFRQMRRRSIVADRVTIISILSLLTETDLDEGRQVHIHVTRIGLDLDTSVGNVLVSMYGLCSSLPDALAIFNRLSCQDAITFVNMITACSNQAAIAEGRGLHSMLEGTEMEHNVVIGNAVVNLYSKCGSLMDAQRMFEKMPQRNVVTWSTIISAYAQHGEAQKVFLLYSKMCERSIIPDNVSHTSLLVACSHSGYVNEALALYRSIRNEHTALSLDLLNCIIDLLGRSGSLNFAGQLVRCMPFLPSNLSWSILACACHIHVDIDRGCFAANYALEIDADNAMTYVLLSNIYGAFAMEI